jgi:hypothetical protein
MYRMGFCLVAVLGVVFVSGCGSKDRFVIAHDISVGGFPTTGTVRQAVKVFGQPSSRDQGGAFDQCRLTWPSLGLTMQTYYTGGALNPCGPAARHASSTVTSHKWHTTDGLKIGDSLSRLRQLYPEAQKESANKWQLIGRSLAGVPFPGLEAALKNGRIVSFTVYGPRSAF